MAEGSKKRKPTIDVVKACPCCKEKLRIRHYRRKTSPTVPAEYDVWTEIEPDKQMDLGYPAGDGNESGAPGTEVTPAKSKKKKTAKKKTTRKKT